MAKCGRRRGDLATCRIRVLPLALFLGLIVGGHSAWASPPGRGDEEGLRARELGSGEGHVSENSATSASRASRQSTGAEADDAGAGSGVQGVAGERNTLSGFTYKTSCYDDGGVYQLDIMLPDGGESPAGLWSSPRSSRTDPDNGRSRRDSQQAGQLQQPAYRSKRVQWLMMEREHRSRRRRKRSVTNYVYNVWPDAVIPYEIDKDFENSTQDLIVKCMRHWMEHTCLQFVPRTNHTDYVRFLQGRGCCSSVGRQGGPQNVSLGHGCLNFGTIIHEIGHVVGFWHEQSRPDRDDHVTVVEENIVGIERHNFHKLSEKTVDSMHQPYDYDSVMHYGPRYFTLNNKDTIISKGGPIGQRLGLSAGDILQTKLLYKCSDAGVCGGTLFEPKGFISSPSYPQHVIPNFTCDWSIAVPGESALKFEFLDIDLAEPDDGKCDDSYVELREGLGELAPLIGRFCGNTKPDTIFIDGGAIWVRFKSGRRRYRGASGFAARYQSVSFHKFITDTSGTIKSLNYPLSFPPDADSMWQITVKYGFIVTLRINELLIPFIKHTGCHGDYLILYDGADSQSKLITKLCRSQKRVGVASKGPALRIELHSAKREKESPESWTVTRFYAKYAARDVDECRTSNGGCQQVCLNLIGNYVCGCQHGYNIAPNYHNCTDVDECQRENGGCSHTCVNTVGSFHCACPIGYHISPESSTQCVDTNECEHRGMDVCEQHCHNIVGSFMCSCEPGYVLHEDGQHCQEIPGCGGHLHDEEGVITRPDIPANNTHSVDCIWFINLQSTSGITFRLDIYDWPANSDCPDYLAIRGENAVSGRLSRICGEGENERVYNTTSNRMMIHYNSDWPHEGGFVIEYRAAETSRGTGKKCGGVLNGTGIIETPDFPHPYPNSLECVWRINGSVIRFHYQKFDVEQESSCLFDYLELHDGPENGVESKHIGRFCGSAPPPREIKPATGELWLIFRSDATVKGQGFHAVYEVENNITE
ncbi:bone morphogenetic protein 1-like [Diadema antillarum]|uniref:bone morphogenetic protein 1-like n=1 Tax=Diadema antillarum TaxID=105358 RepID=UPI003A8663CE